LQVLADHAMRGSVMRSMSFPFSAAPIGAPLLGYLSNTINQRVALALPRTVLAYDTGVRRIA
jgi:hypothetical protein